LASHKPEEAPNPPGASHHVTSEPLKKKKKKEKKKPVSFTDRATHPKMIQHVHL